MSKTLKPISTLPEGSSFATVQLYQDAKGCYNGPFFTYGVEECIPYPGKDGFEITLQEATHWCERERPLPVFKHHPIRLVDIDLRKKY